jgi:hypothetical protein
VTCWRSRLWYPPRWPTRTPPGPSKERLAIARARQIARTQNRVITSSFPLEDADLTTVERIRSLQLDFAGWVDLFHTVASTEARTIFAQSGAPVAIGGVSTQITRLADQPIPS